MEKRFEMKLKRQAKQLGYQLVSIEHKAAYRTRSREEFLGSLVTDKATRQALERNGALAEQ
jgi:hypothetical protein